MASNQRDFRKDKPKPLKLRIVCGVKILTILERKEYNSIMATGAEVVS